MYSTTDWLLQLLRQTAHVNYVTSLRLQNDVATSFWHHNDVIFTSCVRCDVLHQVRLASCQLVMMRQRLRTYLSNYTLTQNFLYFTTVAIYERGDTWRNGLHFVDAIFKCILLINVMVLKVSWCFVLDGSTDNAAILVWDQKGTNMISAISLQYPM